MKTFKQMKEEREAKIVRNYLKERDLKAIDLMDYCKLYGCVNQTNIELPGIENILMDLLSNINFEDGSNQCRVKEILAWLDVLKRVNDAASEIFRAEVKI